MKSLGHTPLQPGVAIALFALTALGCAVGPNYEPPEIQTPDVWHQELTAGLGEGDASLETWWQNLNDPVLDGLIERATAGNLDLAEAVSRINEGLARRGIAVGEWFPGVNAGFDYARQQLSEEIPGPSFDSKPFNSLSTGLDASWEIDLFGRIRRSVDAADGELAADNEDYRDVLVIHYPSVAQLYVEARALQTRIEYAGSNVQSQLGTLELTIDRNKAGLVGDLDVRQAELNVARTESVIPALRIRLAETTHRLAVLVGGYPDAVDAELAKPAPIPSVPDEVAVGLPVNLLRQRPDLRSAERALAAQTARIGVATADLYPRLTLLGTFAFQATDAAKWITGDALAYSFGPAITWNIFDGGRIRANIRAQDALADQALRRYEQTVLGAYEEAENAIAGYVQERQRRDALERSVDAARDSVMLVTELYRAGLVDFQNVLDMERSLFDQQDQYAQSQGEVTGNLIRLYRALGGGWAPDQVLMAAVDEAKALTE
jgi:multidrug efflux system outer membrane protein